MPEQPDNRTVLVVDGDPEAWELMNGVLAGYVLEFAADALDAIRRIHADTFHGYVLDYWLRSWSGPQLCRLIRENDAHAPILFCTAANRDEDRERGLRAGANDYLCKPVDPQVLRGKLGALLTLAERESLKARDAAELAVINELDRARNYAAGKAEPGLTAAFLERVARLKACKAFAKAGGTRAHFERWWPAMFQSVRANHGAFGEQCLRQ